MKTAKNFAENSACFKEHLQQTETFVKQQTPANRIELQPDNVRKGLGKLVLTLLKLIHELLERQAIQRIAAGNLTEAQSDQLGLTLMRQAEEINKLRELFDLAEEELNLNLGPLGKLL